LNRDLDLTNDAVSAVGVATNITLESRQVIGILHGNTRINDTFKGKWFIGGHFGQDFAIQLYIRRGQRWYKTRIIEISILSNAGLDALDPQLAPFASLHFAIAKGILPCLVHTSNRNAVAIF
jgi:hypothetical protein